jgi:predicted nuclease with TOPRIM domain
MYNAQSPVTPAGKGSGSGSRPTSKLQDSPFSDYFTDDGNSNSNSNDSSYRAPSVETQQLLVRINNLQAQLIRSSPEDVLSEHEKAVIVGRKVSEIETQFHALNSETLSQTRRPAELEDSGLFLEDDEDEAGHNEETPDAQMESFERAAKTYLASEVDAEREDEKAKHDMLLQDARRVLESVSKANERLRQFNTELRANYENSGSIIAALETENAKLRSKTTTLEYDHDALQSATDTLRIENDSLKTDLSLNRAELLYLKLRHRALEVEVEALHNAGHRLESYAPDLREEIQQIKRTKVRERMSAWEDAWLEIEQKMRERRTKYDRPAEMESSFGQLFDVDDAGEDGDEIVEITEITHITETKTAVLGEDSAVGIEDTPSPPSADSVQEEYIGTVQVNQSTQTDKIYEERPEPQDTRAAYADQTTQTSPLPSSATSSWVLATRDENEIQSNTNLDDCAITTSSEDNGNDSLSGIATDAGGDDEVEVKTPTSPLRAAWHDLWDGLTNLAGMGEGY